MFYHYHGDLQIANHADDLVLSSPKKDHKIFVKELQQSFSILSKWLQKNPSRPDINLNFYVHTSLWCLKRFYVSLKNLLRHRKEVWKWKFKLIFILIQLSEMYWMGGVNTDKSQLWLSAKLKINENIDGNKIKKVTQKIRCSFQNYWLSGHTKTWN